MFQNCVLLCKIKKVESARSDAKKFAENVCRFRPLKNPYVLESDHPGLVAWPA